MTRSGNGSAITQWPKKLCSGGGEFGDGQERGLPAVPGADGASLSLCILVTSTGNWRGLSAFLQRSETDKWVMQFTTIWDLPAADKCVHVRVYDRHCHYVKHVCVSIAIVSFGGGLEVSHWCSGLLPDVASSLSPQMLVLGMLLCLFLLFQASAATIIVN